MPGDAARPHLPPLATELQPPPSPRTHRTLRRLQSAHSLGSKAAGQSSLITQQRLREQHQQLQLQHNKIPNLTPTWSPTPAASGPRTGSPVKRDFSGANYASATTSSAAAAAVVAAAAAAAAGNHYNRDSSSNTNLNRSSTQRTRDRASSDAAMLHHGHPAGPGAARRSGFRKPPFLHTNLSMQTLIRDGPPDGDFVGALEATRYKILDEGIKSDSDGMSSLRIYVWLILLDTPILSTDDYLSLVHRGASPAYSKIRNDTFRTLTTDPLFRRRVSEASLIRLLNAIAWKLYDSREAQRRERPPTASSTRSSLAYDFTPSTTTTESPRPIIHGPGSSPASKRTRALTLTTEGSDSSVMGGGGAGASGPEPGMYVQGMNVLAAPFLYAARSEAEAFVAFHTLLTRECPGYIRGAMDGVHKGLALVDKVLAVVDPKLSLFLISRGLKAEVYAFPSVLTLCACTPPLPEVLRLWDFLFAYGPHLNILCIVAQLHLMRDKILKSTSPGNLLRSLPALQADVIKRVSMTILQRIPRDIYAEIVTHAQ